MSVPWGCVKSGALELEKSPDKPPNASLSLSNSSSPWVATLAAGKLSNSSLKKFLSLDSVAAGCKLSKSKSSNAELSTLCTGSLDWISTGAGAAGAAGAAAAVVAVVVCPVPN